MNPFCLPSRRARGPCSLVVLLLLACAATPARATPVVFNASGFSSVGNPVTFKATLAITGTLLSVRLDNLSPVPSEDASDVLSSFYFDVVKSGSIRPALTYLSGTGQVYQVLSGTTDRPFVYQPTSSLTPGFGPSNLKAVNANDKTWQFRAMNPALPPLEGFGIGTVGNSALSPNGFTPSIVGPAGPTQIAFSLYTGADIDPIGILASQYLVRDTATFTFGGLAGFSEADIGPDALFGLGTMPDSIIELPEPGGMALAALGAVVAGGWRMSRRRRRAGR